MTLVNSEDLRKTTSDTPKDLRLNIVDTFRYQVEYKSLVLYYNHHE